MRRAALLTALAAVLAVALPAPLAGGAGRVSVYVIDNAFLRGVQRPDVRIARDTTVTWRWRAQQSHGLAVRSGPARFTAAVRTRGGFSHRFTRAGTYRIVCPLHAPGMKMTVVVR